MLGNVVGSWIAYGVGCGGRIWSCWSATAGCCTSSPRSSRRADRWFEPLRASAAVFFGRMVPVVRTFISLPAGVARMPFGRFTTLTIAGVHPLGDGLGGGRRRRRAATGRASGTGLDYVDYAVVVLVVAASATRRRAGRRPAAGRRCGGQRASRRWPPPSAGRAASIGHAVALGLLQGPAELLPISSSGHIALVPWLLGWPYADLDAELRKSFEVALHAGTAAALLIVLRREVVDTVR